MPPETKPPFTVPQPAFDPVHVLESITDGFIALDREWRIVYINAQAERIVFQSREAILGRTIWDVFPEVIGSEFERQYRRAADEQITVAFEEYFAPLASWFELRVHPSSDGLTLFFQNANARREAEEALRRSQEDLQLAIDAAHLGTFYCDWPLDKITWNDTCKQHFFLPPDAEVDFDLFYSLLHPDDREQTRQAIERAFAEHAEYDVEYRTLAPDGRTHWINAVGRFYYQPDGSPIRFDGITIDISARKAAEEDARRRMERERELADLAERVRREGEARLRETQVRLEAALSAGGIATWTWDVLNDRVVADADLARLFSVSPEDAAGGKIAVYLQAIHPEDRDRVGALIADALASRDVYEAEYRVVLPDGSPRWLRTRGSVERDAQGRAVALPGVVEDITERTKRERRERFLAEFAERVGSLTDPEHVIAEAVHAAGRFFGVSRCIFADIDIEADTCAIRPGYQADDSVASIEGVVPISAFGAFVVTEYAARRAVVVDDVRADPIKAPPDTVAAYEAIGILAHVTVPVVQFDRVVSCISLHNAVPRHWEPEEVELLRAVVERTWLMVEVLRQQRALAREAEERREVYERTEAILSSITDAFFAIDQDWRFTYLNTQAERLLSRTREEIVGQCLWDEFPASIDSTFERQYRRAVRDGVTVSFEEYFAALDTWFDVRAYPSPGGLSIFFQNVTARKRAEEERERLLVEQQARARREELLNRIGQALRDSVDTDAAQETAAALLGEALGADRCYFAIYDLPGGSVKIARDWHRADLSSIKGTHPFVNTAAMFRELYRDSHTSVIDDASTAAISPQTLANMQSLQLRSRISVALVDDNGLSATLTAAMADAARDWTAEEVALVEAAATQLRIGMEAARVQQREHRIATDLQNALQPPLPDHIPGLSVGKFTRPALAEAQVGGDFFDIFPLDKALYALVIGDVSGKGLAAAQQLALIRNSLRTTLYLSRMPAQAAASLNAIVTSHDLLVGFVTAWVGVYDAGEGRIVYCSCGHEPALVRRADGTVEILETTGPPLGVAENAEYAENTITLSSGEALLLYTDGVSEAGPSRRDMLGTEGLIRLVKALPADRSAQEEAEVLVAGVSAYTSGVFRDDVAVMLVRRE